jgi:protein-disulfide isomerase
MNFRKCTQVILPEDVFVGVPNAPLTLMQFGDYECEMAQHDNFVVGEVLKRFPELVKLNYRHFPQLRIHQRAHKAAEAAITAAQVGKFAQMHEILLCNRRNLGAASLTGYARELGIGGMDFLDALVSGTFGRYVQDDLALGIKMGLKSSPGFFINGIKLRGAVTVNNLCDQVEMVWGQMRPVSRKKAA